MAGLCQGVTVHLCMYCRVSFHFLLYILIYYPVMSIHLVFLYFSVEIHFDVTVDVRHLHLIPFHETLDGVCNEQKVLICVNECEHKEEEMEAGGCFTCEAFFCSSCASQTDMLRG